MKDACILAPIHPPKFDDGLHFVRTYNELYDDDHIYLVFTTKQESQDFAILANGLKYRSIVTNGLRSQSPTTEKKYVGLKEIFNTTEFVNVGVVDIDTDFFRHIDYSALFHDYNKRGIIYGNAYQFSPWPIIESPLKFFNDQDQQRLREFTENCQVYFWFNDVPVFNKQYFLELLTYIDFDNRQHELVWADFDFILYVYYLILKGLFVIQPILNNGSPLNAIFLEDQLGIDPTLFRKIFEEIQPMWIVKCIEDSSMTKTFMHLHTDRSN
jgi:hypothetical protein